MNTVNFSQSNSAREAEAAARVASASNVRRDAVTRAPIPTAPAARRDAASPREVNRTIADLSAVFDDALMSGDPQVMMMAAASRVRDNSLHSAAVAASIYGSNQSVELHAQIRAFDDARRAQANAAQWNTVARIGAYVAAALAIVVGVVGAVYSAGTSVVAGVGTALVLVSAAATIGVMAAQDIDPKHEPPPKWLTIAIAIVAIVGAALSAGAGSGSAFSMVSSAVSTTAQTIDVSMQIAVECKWMQDPPPVVHIALAVVSLIGAAAGAAGSASSASDDVATGAEALGNAASSAARIAQVAEAVGEGLRGAALVVQGGARVGAAIETHSADESTAEAGRHRDARQHNADLAHDAVEAMKEVMKAFRHAAEAAVHMGEEINHARRAVLGNFVRA